MGKRVLNFTEDLYDYLLDNSLREPPVLQALREETNRMMMSAMQSPPEQCQFIALLLKMMAANRVLEVGIFVGYSTLWMATNLPEDGTIVACDIDEKWTSVGQRYWQQAGLDHKIDLRLAPAIDTLDQLIDEGQADSFDFAFVDADKESYWSYYERALVLVRKGGMIAIDNVLWGGSVINPDNQSSDANAIRQFNARIHQDNRVDMVMLNIGDGLTLAIVN